VEMAVKSFQSCDPRSAISQPILSSREPLDLKGMSSQPLSPSTKQGWSWSPRPRAQHSKASWSIQTIVGYEQVSPVPEDINQMTGSHPAVCCSSENFVQIVAEQAGTTTSITSASWRTRNAASSRAFWCQSAPPPSCKQVKLRH
jgi:hypothetical protein